MFNVDSELGVINAYGIVGNSGLFEDAFDAGDFKKALKSMLGRDFELHLMSNGGEVHEGTSIANQIRAYPGKVTVVIDSMAASIASVIAVAADEVHMHPSAYMMVHNPWTVAIGDAAEFRETAEWLDRVGETIAEFYAEKTGRPREEWMRTMQKDTYFDAEEALDIGLADKIIGKKYEAVAVTHKEPVAFATAMPSVVSAKHRLREDRLWNKK